VIEFLDRVTETFIGCVAQKLDASIGDVAEDTIGGDVSDDFGGVLAESLGRIYFNGHEHIRNVD
jgi:hypothetical protein